VALGLFAAFIIPIGQIFLSAFLALPLRANVPLAALITFVTNPFTLPFWLVVANRIGDFALRLDSGSAAVVASVPVDSGWWGILTDASQVAGATLVGYLVLSLVAPMVGWVLSGWIWRLVVSRRRAKRLKTMEARLDRRLGSQ
jgi:hypothetical protein